MTLAYGYAKGKFCCFNVIIYIYISKQGIAPKDDYIILHSNRLIVSVPDEGFSRTVS
jgi:hypothetical protein